MRGAAFQSRRARSAIFSMRNRFSFVGLFSLALLFGCAQGDPSSIIGQDATVKPDVALDGDPDAGPDVTKKPDGAPEEDTPMPPTGCTGNADCASSPIGPVCDTATGLCAQCTTAQDMCPPGQFCDPMNNTCRSGCTSDADCGAGSITRCDMTTRRCVGCTADADCALGTLCRMGACVPGCDDGHGCGVGQSCCANQCVDVQTSAMHCGTCGTACPMGGACCAGACQSVSNDAMNCGRCGNRCTASHGSPACSAGTCIVGTCDTGFGDCDRMGPNGCESDLSSDAMHCGACGRPCTSGSNAMARCSMGACVNECSGGYGDCDGNAANGCETAIGSDARNCGMCGRACPAGPSAMATCAVSVCGLACSPGSADCDMMAPNGCEVSVNTDPRNCGSCGVICAFPNASATCASGRCALGACNAGFGDCDGDPSNGCETPTSSSNTHCGACGTRCASGTACSMGACGSICMGGTTFCGDRCVSLATDVSNCGACARACPMVSNGTPSCRSGACGATCNRGFGDCDGSPSNGCETSLSAATDNCGSCGNVCRASNASVGCTDGACRVESCNTGFANCNGSDGDGCEVNTGADVSNCGGCARTCSLANAGARCTSGSCRVNACSPGFANCNGVDSDGCEVNTSNNNNNCGSCGVMCPAGTACSGATCASVCTGGTTFCGGACVSTASDARNCGGCGNVCPAGQACSGGVCRAVGPSNDTCAGATTLSLSATNLNIAATNVGAATDFTPPCGSGGADVWFRFTLGQRELVYADTVGAGFDTILYFMGGCTAPLSSSPPTYACNDDMGSAGCTSGGLQSQVLVLLNPGTYYLVLAGYSTATGSATIHFQHLPVGNGLVYSLNPGANTVSGATSGAGVLTSTCGAATGPENTHFWKSCPESPAGTVSATTCSRASWDTVIYTRNANGVGDGCNDDSCGLQSSLSTSVSAGAGLHAVYVDGFSGSSGSYSVAITRP